MQINKVSIHNFRSIKDGTFVLKDYSLLIGANNAGKSNIIDAIRVFYEHDKMKYNESSDLCWAKTDDEVWIEIEYILTDEEYNDLKEEYRLPNNSLKIRKYIKTTEKGADGKAKSGYYAYNSEGKICDNLFYGEKNVGSGKLGNIIYIPAQSTVEEQTKLTGPSPLRELISNVLERVIAGNAAYDKLKADISSFSEAIKAAKTPEEQSLMRLESEISDCLKDWGTKFKFDFKTLDPSSIVKNLVSYTISETVDNMNPAQMGSGFQRHLVFSLIDVAARFPVPKKPKKEHDFTPNMTFLLFEEPEAFLHPGQQLVLCRNLKSLASKEMNQVLVSSHSPHFVSQNTDYISSIIKLTKTDKITNIGQISQESLNNIFAKNLELPDGVKDDRSPEDKQVDMESIKYFLWLDPERCGCFFAKYVLLVEGPTEKGLFNYIIDKERLNIPDGGVFIFDSMGKWNMAKFMRLFELLHITHSVIFDDDNNKPDQKPWNDYINNNRNNYTKNIKTFSGDLEAYLGVQKPNDSRKKPQHILYNWISGNISEERQDSLKSLIGETIQ